MRNLIKEPFHVDSSHFIGDVGTEDFNLALTFKLPINVRKNNEILVMGDHQVQCGLIWLVLD